MRLSNKEMRKMVFRAVMKQFTIDDSHMTNVVWDGRNKSGKKVRSGVYFLRFKAEDHRVTKKLLFVR